MSLYQRRIAAEQSLLPASSTEAADEYSPSSVAPQLQPYSQQQPEPRPYQPEPLPRSQPLEALLANARQQLLVADAQPEPEVETQATEVCPTAIAAEPMSEPLAVAVPTVVAEPAVAEPQPQNTISEPEPQIQTSAVAEPQSHTAAEPESATSNDTPVLAQLYSAARQPQLVTPEQAQPELGNEFQCLYFSVAGILVAVPLQQLGGIRPLVECTKVPGQPDWMIGQRFQDNARTFVVDTCRWLMPERHEQLIEQVHYQYLVKLGNSRWSLACEALVDAKPLQRSEIRWRKETDKRRYLAGIVKEKMCVVLDVPELIQLLDAGLDSKLKEL